MRIKTQVAGKTAKKIIKTFTHTRSLKQQSHDRCFYIYFVDFVLVTFKVIKVTANQPQYIHRTGQSKYTIVNNVTFTGINTFHIMICNYECRTTFGTVITCENPSFHDVVPKIMMALCWSSLGAHQHSIPLKKTKKKIIRDVFA